MAKHYCNDVENYDLSFLLQIGIGVRSKILIVGESPAANGWILSGKAFYNDKGKLVPSGVRLNKLLKSLNFSLEECSFTEICKCVIGNERNLLKTCGNKCWKIFVKQIKGNDFKLIIPLGLETLRIFNNQLTSHYEVGKLAEIKIKNKDYYFLPLFHPSPINPRGLERNLKIVKEGREEMLKILKSL